jgi:D-alanyl-D-alanine dipeptidase
MKILLILSLSLFVVYAQKIAESEQLIVVTAKNWSTSNGKLQRYERSKNNWQKVGNAIAIKLGRNGLGWGRGLHDIPKNAKIVKKEGDGKAPAGIFSLKQAFGYEPFNVKYPYSVYKTTDHCVDDINSKFYNKIVDSKKVKIDYKSKEHMKFPKNYYKYGIVVNHNHIDEAGAIKGAGSCIFMHIKNVPTAGCTVMSESEMKKIIKWLNVNKNPLLVQGTEEVVKELWKKIIITVAK